VVVIELGKDACKDGFRQYRLAQEEDNGPVGAPGNSLARLS
jgi:hypothetical protein